MKSSIITIFILVVVLLALGTVTYFMHSKNVLNEKDTAATQSLSASEETPYTDIDGNSFSFDDYRGNVRVVNVWASWCPFCAQELKDFEVLAEEYRDQNVAVIAVNRKETKEKVIAFLKTVGTFEHTVFTIDLTDAFYTSVGGFSMPETVFYDARGNVVMHRRGALSLEEMRTLTEQALNATK